MKKLATQFKKRLHWGFTFAAWGSYLLLLIVMGNRIGPGLASVSILPVIVTSWYFGLIGSILSIIAAIAFTISFLIVVSDYTLASAVVDQGLISGNVILFLLAPALGLLSKQNRQLKQEILERKKLEDERHALTGFTSHLYEIASATLESNKVTTKLDTLADQLGSLFSADVCIITLWDDALKKTTLVAKSAEKGDSALKSHYYPGLKAFSSSVMDAGTVVEVENVNDSKFSTPKVNYYRLEVDSFVCRMKFD